MFKWSDVNVPFFLIEMVLVGTGRGEREILIYSDKSLPVLDRSVFCISARVSKSSSTASREGFVPQAAIVFILFIKLKRQDCSKRRRSRKNETEQKEEKLHHRRDT
jgi:hypothetical protein